MVWPKITNLKSQISKTLFLNHWGLRCGGWDLSRGFTLIEILVVFSVIGILSTASVVSFVQYNETQTLANAAKDLRQMLTTAKSRSQSQLKPPECEGETLEGYEVALCESSAECSSGGNYELLVACGGDTYLVDPAAGAKPNLFPRNISLCSSSQTIFYRVLQGGVDGAGDIILGGYGRTKIVSVDAAGNISIHDGSGSECGAS